MLDFWGLDSSIPTASALSQQRAKLKPDALEAVFRHFNSASMELPPASFMDSHYRFLAADGSTCTFSALRLSHHQTTTVDRHDVLDGIKNIYIGDRGYCSYNNMAHVVEQGQYFLFRTKDIHSKGLVGNFNFPDAESFDIDVSVILVRSHSKKFWQTSTQKVTYALLIRQLLSITLNMEVMIHMSCPSVFYASLSALLHTSAS